jgi:hypothetical protein
MSSMAATRRTLAEVTPSGSSTIRSLIRDYEAGAALEELVRRPPLPPGKTPMDMRAETPRA